MENRSYKIGSMEQKYLKIWKNQFFKVKTSILELEKYFIELRGIELKDIEIENKRDIKTTIFKTDCCFYR